MYISNIATLIGYQVVMLLSQQKTPNTTTTTTKVAVAATKNNNFPSICFRRDMVKSSKTIYYNE